MMTRSSSPSAKLRPSSNREKKYWAIGDSDASGPSVAAVNFPSFDVVIVEAVVEGTGVVVIEVVETDVVEELVDIDGAADEVVDKDVVDTEVVDEEVVTTEVVLDVVVEGVVAGTVVVVELEAETDIVVEELEVEGVDVDETAFEVVDGVDAKAVNVVELEDETAFEVVDDVDDATALEELVLLAEDERVVEEELRIAEVLLLDVVLAGDEVELEMLRVVETLVVLEVVRIATTLVVLGFGLR